MGDGVVQRQLCFHTGGLTCHYEFNIDIRNCGTFYVYKPADITTCSLRICTGMCVPPCISKQLYKSVKKLISF